MRPGSSAGEGAPYRFLGEPQVGRFGSTAVPFAAEDLPELRMGFLDGIVRSCG